MRCCPKCGGSLYGDGYTMVIHCEFVEVPDGIEPDANPVYCEFTDEMLPAWEEHYECAQRL